MEFVGVMLCAKCAIPCTVLLIVSSKDDGYNKSAAKVFVRIRPCSSSIKLLVRDLLCRLLKRRPLSRLSSVSASLLVVNLCHFDIFCVIFSNVCIPVQYSVTDSSLINANTFEILSL